MSRIYSISSISNRDLQLLYQYRILRQPSNYLKAVYTDSLPQQLVLPPTDGQVHSTETYYSEEASASQKEQDYWIYRVPISNREPRVPLLEFPDVDAKGIADLTEVKVSEDTMTFFSKSQDVEGLKINLYWVTSFTSVQSILSGYVDELKLLKEKLENYSPAAGNGSGLTITGGIPDNLVKVAENGTDLIDSGFRITGPVTSQDLINISNDELARLVSDISGDILIREDANTDHILQNTYGGGKITLSGSGTWYLTNVTNDVNLVNFKGSIYAVNCPAVRSSGSAFLEDVYLINSFMVHNNGTINNLYLFERSAIKQNSGKITTLQHVGAGCEYYSGTTSAGEPVYDRIHIEGTACFASGLIIINGKDVSFVAGQHEDPVPPSRIRVVIEGGT